MQFIALPFVLFFLLIFSGNWLLSPHRRARNGFLLIASYVFYGQLGMSPLTLLICSTVINYCIGEGIVGAPSKRKKRWLSAGIGFNIGVLGLFKYFNFFRQSLEQISHFFGLEAHLPLLQFVLPIGISFYTFQALTYLVDLYRGHGIRAKSLLDFALFLAFFPQLLIGPICRSRDLLPQIHALPLRKVPDVPKAILLLLSGYFKKAILATLLFDHGVTDAFHDPESFSAIGLWAAMVGYSVQLYCDFSGYTDIARGCAILLGFSIPENFRNPYVATNLGEFWKRWHITFSQWLRDYIYLPLGGSRRSAWRISLNLFITFLFCGLWHGASWGFIIWGAAHGIGMAIHKRNRDRMRANGIDPNAPPGFFWGVIGWLYTFGFVALSRVVFQSPDLSSAAIYYQRLFQLELPGKGAEITLLVAILIGLASNFVGPSVFSYLHKIVIRIRSGLHQKSQEQPSQAAVLGIVFSLFTLSALLGSVLLLLLLRPGGVAPYLYFRF